MNSIFTRMWIAIGLVGLGIFVMNSNEPTDWLDLGYFFVGWVFVIVGSLSLGLDLGRLGEGKRR